MTVVSWWRELDGDGRVMDVGGFARVRLDPWQFYREALARHPILSPIPSLALEKYEGEWIYENIAPLVWLSMPVHDGPSRS